ncbi:hypothetical protein H0H92_008201 [Tricholoma furcatifolium]|nr:hypothetical protein H0H92_008201 [Tricholoma furcatifolium]
MPPVTPHTPPPQSGYLADGNKCLLNRPVTVQLLHDGTEGYIPYIQKLHTLKEGSQVVICGNPRSTIRTGDNAPTTPDNVRYRFEGMVQIEVYENDAVPAIQAKSRLVRHTNLRPILSGPHYATKGFAEGDIVSIKAKDSSVDKLTFIKPGQLLRINCPSPVSPHGGLPLEPGRVDTGVYAAKKVTKILKSFRVYNPDLLPRDYFTLEDEAAI